MSLKAKIEAVIYASEEPVTLNQLIGLLGHEAQAEIDRNLAQQESDQQALSLNETELDLEEAAQSDPSLDPDALNSEVLTEPDSTSLPEEAVDAEPAAAIATEQGSEAPPETPEDAASAAAKAEKEKARRLREHFRTLLEALIADYASP